MIYATKEGYEFLKGNFEALKQDYDALMGKLSETDKSSKLKENEEFRRIRTNAMYSYTYERDKLSKILNEAVLIEDTDEFKSWNKDVVIRKSEVTVEWDGRVESFKIVGSCENDVERSLISCDAPLSQTLLGHKKGDVVDFNGSTIIIIDINEINELTFIENSKSYRRVIGS